jgi:L-lysine exporter family protein LysE/ArgO
MSPFLAGFGLSLSLIIAIGPQNAHVLRVALLRRHVALTVLACALTDVALIALGVAGMASLIAQAQWIAPVMMACAVVFLLAYGARAARAAWLGPDRALDASALPGEAGAAKAHGASQAVLTALAFSWLNPHAWIDTAVLVGGASASYASPMNWWFGLGAMLGSITWFVGLGSGASLLAPWMARPGTWRVIDVMVAITMWATAAGLLWAQWFSSSAG